MQKKLPLINSAHGSETRNIINEIIKAVNDRGLEILSESGFLTWLDENGIKHRGEVARVSDLPSGDSLNTVRGVEEDNKIYIKKENGWIPFQSIDISKINYVEEKADRANRNFSYISIKDFPRLGPEAEDSARINRAIESADATIVQLYNEVYETKNPIKIKSYTILQGQVPRATIIRNTGGTDIITPYDDTKRFYHSQINDLTLDGVSNTGQTALNLPNFTYFTSRNIYVSNVKRCHYMSGTFPDGTLGGCYYNHFYNPVFSNSYEGFYFDDIANENTVYGGKMMTLNIGAELRSNSVKFFGTAFEGIKDWHVKFYGLNNSLYGPRMEGKTTSIGILNAPVESFYANFVFVPHFQGLNKNFQDDTGTLMVIGDQGLNIPVRAHYAALKSKRTSFGGHPMVDMEDTSINAGSIMYRSRTGSLGDQHFEAYSDGSMVARINGYGDFESLRPNRGLLLTSPNGTQFRVRVTDDGQLNIYSI